MREYIIKTLQKALKADDISLESPKDLKHGDFSSNIALIRAKQEKKNPRELAAEIKGIIEGHDKGNIFEKIEIAGPGFINFFIKNSFVKDCLKEVLEKNETYGSNDLGKGTKVIIEFVSANPTGPLHIGHGRWAAIGDSIANILDFSGYKAHREFYVNNVGRQVNLLIESVKAAMNDAPVPEDGYNGTYIKDVGELAKKENPKDLKGFVLNTMLDSQKQTLSDMQVCFDEWFFENTLHDSGEVKKTIELLKKKGATYEKEGAVWFRSESFGDDKDRVLVRENGDPTYFAADITYHANKFKRGFDLLINVWGTDHHGYVKRLQSALEAIGLPSHKLDIIIGQLVALYRGSEPVRMSKRTGEMITLKEVVDEIGKDAMRFFLLMTSADSHMDFDIELAKKQTLDNPVYYIQYAYARICNIIKTGGINIPLLKETDLGLLVEESERELMMKVLDFPEEVKICAKTMQPHHLVRYSRELAAVIHSYYHKCRVICDDQELMKARLILMESTRIVISNMLKLLKVSAPERM